MIIEDVEISTNSHREFVKECLRVLTHMNIWRSSMTPILYPITGSWLRNFEENNNGVTIMLYGDIVMTVHNVDISTMPRQDPNLPEHYIDGTLHLNDVTLLSLEINKRLVWAANKAFSYIPKS